MSFLGNSTSEVFGLVGSAACRVVVRPRRLKPAARCRRRGNVMLFVIFVLGTLFASSIAFLTLMRADLEGVASRKSATELEGVISGLADQLMSNLVQGVMGQEFVNQAGLDGICGTPDDVNIPVGRVPYVQIFEDCMGDPAVPTGRADGLADNPDVLPYVAMIAGVHPLISSIEPYDSGFTGNPSLDMEYFAVTDLYRAWDDRADVHTGLLIGNIQPTNPVSHPLRIRALDEGDTGPAGPFTYNFDPADDSFSRHRALSDADGDGVVDSRLFRISLIGRGEADWGPTGFILGDTDDINCDGTTDGGATGAPSFTTINPAMMTPLPCDDFDGSGSLESGTVYPQALRRALAARLRDPDTTTDDLHDLYFSARVIQNGGLVNINASHRTLVDNLFGLDEIGAPVGGQMLKLPYGSGIERSLRHRGILAPFRPDDSLSLLGALGEDMLGCASEEPCGLDGSLYRTLFGALTNAGGAAIGELQWTPVLDEPGISGTDDFFDLDWAGRWMNPNAWNDLNNSAGLGNQINFDISHLLTTQSTDDMFLRNGKFDPDGPAGPIAAGLLTAGLPQYNPASDGLADASGNPYFPNPVSPDSAVDMYPAYDPNYDPATGAGDRSFIDATTGLPKVPLTVVMDAVDGYGRPRDAGGNVADDVRYGHLQFCLHSIGNINNPTRREIQTVQDYFTIMLRNVTGLNAAQLADQAAQLTANFIDFADFDSGAAPFAGFMPGGRWDYPTMVQSRTGKFFAGVEKQPFISEVYVNANSPAEGGVELFYPHATDTLDLGTLGYGIRVIVDDAVAQVVWPLPFTDMIGSSQRYLYYGSEGFVVAGPRGSIDIDEIKNLGNGDIVQLIRRLPNGNVAVVDEVILNDPNSPPLFNASMQRDTLGAGGWRATVPKYRVTQAYQTLGSANDDNGIPILLTNVAPVHATTDNMGLESAFPTTGSMLLLMRYANDVRFDPTGMAYVPADKPMTALLKAGSGKLDNGHMPVFDQTQLAQVGVNPVTLVPDGSQPMDGTTLLSIPWGQLVFDYFTALPFDNQFDPTIDPPLFTVPTNPGDLGDPNWPMNPDVDGDGDGFPARNDRGYAQYVAYLRANQPTVDSGGVRVHGRININAAPWKVLDGVPLMHPQVMPIYKTLFPYVGPLPVPPKDEWEWSNVLRGPTGGFPMGFRSFTSTRDREGTAGPVVEKLGEQKAKGIVAYRELRDIADTVNAIPQWRTGSYNYLDIPNGGSRLRKDTSVGLPDVTQRHTAGFLTVGELANVRNGRARDFDPNIPAGAYQMDNGQTKGLTPAGVQNYLVAIAPLAALSDWVTVKGHTFTAYGVLSGHGDAIAVKDKAERFEMVFDRSNVLTSSDPAERPDVIYKLREPLSELNPN